MTHADLAKKWGLRIERIRQAEHMLQLLCQMEYLTEEEKDKVLDWILSAAGEHPLGSKCRHTLVTAGKFELSMLAEQADLSEAEHRGLTQGLGHPDVHAFLTEALEGVIGYKTAAVDPEKMAEMEKKVQEEWEESYKTQAQLEQENEERILEESARAEEPLPAKETQKEIVSPQELALKEPIVLPDPDKWEVACVVYNPVSESHEITLLRTGVQHQIRVDAAFGFFDGSDGQKTLGAVKEWGVNEEGIKKFAELAQCHRSPHLPGKEQLIGNLSMKHGPFDRLFLLEFDLESPNPALREEELSADGLLVRRKREFQWKGLGASSSVQLELDWPGSHMLVHPTSRQPQGMGLVRLSHQRREFLEKWQTRGKWKISWKQISGPGNRPPMLVRNGGKMKLELKGSGVHQGNIQGYSAGFSTVGDGKSAPIRMEDKKAPKTQSWNTAIEFSTDSMTIPSGDNVFDLLPHSHELRESRRSTVRGTPPLKIDKKIKIRGKGRLESENLTGNFVCEQHMNHKETDTTIGTKFKGHSSSNWNCPLHLELPVAEGESISIRFSEGKESKKIIQNLPAPHPDIEANEENLHSEAVAEVSGPGFQWTLDFRGKRTLYSFEDHVPSLELRQQGWSSGFEEKNEQIQLKRKSTHARLTAGFNLHGQELKED